MLNDDMSNACDCDLVAFHVYRGSRLTWIRESHFDWKCLPVLYILKQVHHGCIFYIREFHRKCGGRYLEEGCLTLVSPAACIIAHQPLSFISLALGGSSLSNTIL